MKTTNKSKGRWLAWACIALLSVSAQAANNIVAVVGRQVVTQQELQQRLQQVRAQNAGQSLPADLPNQVLEALISERAQLQAAMDMGIQVGASDVDGALQRVAAQNGLGVDQLVQRVQQEGLSEAGYRQQLLDQLMVQRARDRILDQRLQISAADVQAELIRVAAQQGPQEVELAQVLIAVPEQATAQERAARQAQAASVAQRARGGEDFARLVQAFSSDRASANGSLGLKPVTAYPDLFVQATRDLPEGGVSAVVSSGAGFHVLKVLRRAAGSSALSVVQTHARHILRRAQTEAERQAATATLRQVRADIASGRVSFAAAAQQWGEDGTATQGGDLGWAQPGQFVPAFEVAMNALQPNEVSQPVDSAFGVHLIEVLARRQVEMNDAQRRAWAENQLRNEKAQAVLNAWAREVRAGAYVQIQDPDLR